MDESGPSPTTGTPVVRRRSVGRAVSARLGPGARRRVRLLVDTALAPVVGSWDRGVTGTRVALTLDDGPDPDVTPRLLDVLDEHDVQATFFLLTLRAQKYPHLVSDIVARGHEVALHGLDHRRVSRIAPGEIEPYLRSAREGLEHVAGVPVPLFRPPYGAHSLRSARAARQAGLTVVVWNGEAADWVDRASDVVVADLDRATRPGGIVLFHERLEPDPSHPDPERAAPVTTFDRPDVVARLITRLRARGLDPGSIAQLRERGPMHRTAWLR